MTNPYYTATGNPATGSTGSSAAVRAEFNAIVAAFDKLPTLSGNAGKVVRIDDSASTMTVSSAISESAGGVVTITGATVLAATANIAGAPLATTTGTQTLTNKTLTSPTLNSPTLASAVINGFTGDTSVVNIGSGQVYKDTSGNLGLGVSSPAERLHVKVGANDASLRLENTAGSTKVWNVTAGGGGNYTAGTFAIRNVTDATTPLLIDAVGSLLIGTTSSPYAGSDRGLIEVNGSNDAVISLKRAGTPKAYLQAINDNGLLLANVANGYVAFNTNSVERMRLDSAGRSTLLSGPSGFVTGATKGLQQWFDASGNVAYIYAGQSGVGNYDINIGPTATSFRIDANGNILVNRAAQASGGKLEITGNLVVNLPASVPTLGTNSDMSFQLVSNTSLKILVRGTDGTTRSATLTLA